MDKLCDSKINCNMVLGEQSKGCPIDSSFGGCAPSRAYTAAMGSQVVSIWFGISKDLVVYCVQCWNLSGISIAWRWLAPSVFSELELMEAEHSGSIY